MSDNFDIATEREEFFRDNALRERKPAGPVATGRCLHCDEVLDDVRRWCDSDCRDGWEKSRARR